MARSLTAGCAQELEAVRRELADAQAAAAALAAEKAELVAEKVRHNTLATCIACHAVLSTVRERRTECFASAARHGSRAAAMLQLP